MRWAPINDVNIAFDTRGDGEPVLLIHGAFVADALLPLVQQPALEGLTIIRYHRRGYGDSSGEPTDLATHVADARALLDHLGAVPAHIIGHSVGGAVAMQLAAETPEAVRSLVLLEAAALAQIPSADIVADALAKVCAPAAEGDLEKGALQFLRTVFGRDFRPMLEYNVGPNALAQALADADDAFAGDLPALGAWAFGADEAARIKCPTLIVQGGMSDETIRDALGDFGVDQDAKVSEEITETLRSWIPHAELATLSEMNHALQMQDAWALGVALAPFMAKSRTAVRA